MLKKKLQAKNVKLETNFPLQLSVKSDYGLLFQVLSNLIKNAIEAFPSDMPQKQITLRASFLNNELNILVQDNGKGIPKKIQNKIMFMIQ